MKRYVALLRGINVSGKNKISMSDLAKGFSDLGFDKVFTYLNSGNIVFSCEGADKALLSDRIKQMIQKSFHLDIPVFVILQEELCELLGNAPEWWGNDNKEIYDNLIFVIPPLTCEEFCDVIGKPAAEYEQVQKHGNCVFWSFSRMDYQKTNWWSKTASLDIRDGITIRTANTVRKIAER